MPIYEYRCHTCRRKVSIFFRSAAAAVEPRCPRCDGTNLERVFSRVVVRRGRSTEAASAGADAFEDELGWDPSGDESFAGADPYGIDEMPGMDDDLDPREFARWARAMSAQTGEPLEPDLDQALHDIERGADPEEVLDRLDESEPPVPDVTDDPEV